MAENSENAGNSDNNDFVMPEVNHYDTNADDCFLNNISLQPVGIDSLSSVDKQAMVEDWLNPEQNTDNNIAPQVQQQKQAASDCPCPGTSAQNKISKVGCVQKYFTTTHHHRNYRNISDCRRSVPAYWTWLAWIHPSKSPVSISSSCDSCGSWHSWSLITKLSGAGWKEKVSRCWQDWSSSSTGISQHQDNKMQETQSVAI